MHIVFVLRRDDRLVQVRSLTYDIVIKTICPFLLIITAFHAAGQPVNRTSLRGGVDAGVAFQRNYSTLSLAYYELIGPSGNKTFFVGWTGRLAVVSGNDPDYYTAPARLTRGQSGPGSLFSPILVPNIDTVRFRHVSQTSLNVGIRAEIHLGRVEVGASVDLLGLVLLRQVRTGLVHSSTGLFTVQDSAGHVLQKPFRGADAYQSSTPARFNVRLLGDNDRGMLTTEIYVRVRFSRYASLKTGYQNQSMEIIIANSDTVAGNNRFRNRAGLFYLGLTFPIDPW